MKFKNCWDHRKKIEMSCLVCESISKLDDPKHILDEHRLSLRMIYVKTVFIRTLLLLMGGENNSQRKTHH